MQEPVDHSRWPCRRAACSVLRGGLDRPLSSPAPQHPADTAPRPLARRRERCGVCEAVGGSVPFAPTRCVWSTRPVCGRGLAAASGPAGQPPQLQETDSHAVTSFQSSFGETAYFFSISTLSKPRICVCLVSGTQRLFRRCPCKRGLRDNLDRIQDYYIWTRTCSPSRDKDQADGSASKLGRGSETKGVWTSLLGKQEVEWASSVSIGAELRCWNPGQAGPWPLAL